MLGGCIPMFYILTMICNIDGENKRKSDVNIKVVHTEKNKINVRQSTQSRNLCHFRINSYPFFSPTHNFERVEEFGERNGISLTILERYSQATSLKLESIRSFLAKSTTLGDAQEGEQVFTKYIFLSQSKIMQVL